MKEEKTAPYDVIVFGAGIGGLSTAWKLATSGKSVLVIDAANKVGGVIQSERIGNDYLIERGPNSYTSFGPQEDRFLKEIGLARRVQRRLMAKADRFVWHSGRLHRVPTSPGSLITSSILPWPAKLRIAFGMVKRYDPPKDDVAFGRFLRDVVGDTMVETLLKPFFGGIYAANVDEVSFAACAPKIYDRLAQTDRLIKIPFTGSSSNGSGPKKKKTPKALTNFPNGLQELADAIAAAIEKHGGTIVLNSEKPLEREGDFWKVALPGGGVAKAPKVVLATPAKAAARLLGHAAPAASALIDSIDMVDLNVVHVGVRRREFRDRRPGFGFLTRRNEGVRILGSIWNSRMFPGRAPEGMDLLTCFYGGQLDPRALELDDELLRKQVVRDLRRTMGWRGEHFDLFEVTRWRPALPVLHVGHRNLVDQILEELPEDIHLLSSYLGRPAVPDRIQGGWAMADQLL